MSWETMFSAGLDDDDAAAWGRLATELRAMHDALAASRFDRATVDDLAEQVRGWAGQLAPLEVDELRQVNGRVPQLPVRGHAMLPALEVVSSDDRRVDGTVVFGRWFMGGGMAAHGGVVSLAFDEALGILASSSVEGITRTAYLHVDYRALTPIDEVVTVSAWIDRIEGRKVFVRGEMRHHGVVCAEADGLFLELDPEQGLGRRTTA